jgi:uncharacterized membrane protein
MSTFTQILLAVGFIAILFWLFHFIKQNPGQFSAQNLHKSFFTMGILALLLIGFIALLVIYLK